MNINYSLKKIRKIREIERERSAKIKTFVALLAVLFIGIFIGNIFTQNDFSITGLITGNLPDVGDSNWGTILNNYLLQEHTAEGGHGNITSNNWTNVSITENQISDLKSYRTLNNLTFVGDVNVTGDTNLTGNLTLGEKITFALGEVIDNLVDGFVRIVGSLNITDILILNPQISPINSLEGGVFYNSSLKTLMVYNGTQWEVPGVKNEIKYFNDTSCPPGWGEMQEAVGRYFVAINTTGNLGTIVGTALDDQEDRTHFHENSMGFDGTSYYGWADGSGNPTHGSRVVSSVSRRTVSLASSSGAVRIAFTDSKSADIPYIQLLVCVKT